MQGRSGEIHGGERWSVGTAGHLADERPRSLAPLHVSNNPPHLYSVTEAAASGLRGQHDILRPRSGKRMFAARVRDDAARLNQDVPNDVSRLLADRQIVAVEAHE